MKITIETTSTYEAKVTIDGRELVYGLKNGGWAYRSGLKKGEENDTVGGLVATKLSSSLLLDLLQGWMPDSENPRTGECWETWDKLDDATADDIYERLDL